MTTIESKIVAIAAPSSIVYGKLSRLDGLQPLLEQAMEQATANNPAYASRVKNWQTTSDSLTVEIEGVGRVGLKLIEQEPYKTLKFTAEQSPVDFTFWIQLVEKGDSDTRMRLTLKANLPFVLKMMVGDRLQQGIDQIADRLAQIPYA